MQPAEPVENRYAELRLAPERHYYRTRHEYLVRTAHQPQPMGLSRRH